MFVRFIELRAWHKHKAYFQYIYIYIFEEKESGESLEVNSD